MAIMREGSSLHAMKAGFIGIGHMGRAMAGRLLSEGVELVVWNRTRNKAQGLNAEIAETPAEVVSATPVVFVSLFDSDAVRSVLTAEHGVLEGNCNDKIVIDTSTNHFSAVLDFHAMLKDHRGYYLESPVLGSVGPASQGALTVLVSGEKTAHERALPYLQKIGKNIFYLEKPGLATKMKLINNLTVGSFMTTIAECVLLGEAVGLDKQKVIDILAAGAGNSVVLNANKQKLLDEDFATRFSCALLYKDLHYLQDLSRALKRPLFTGSIVKELYGMTFSKGIENLDMAAIYKLLKEF